MTVYIAERLCKVEREGTAKYFFRGFPPTQEKREDTKSESEEKEEEVMVGGSGDRSEEISHLHNLG